jgi:Xaa-Pro dipeptidase
MSSATVTIEIPPEADARRLDIDAKQQLVAQLLHDSGCEGLLVLHPPNFRWLTAGANPVGLFGRDELPGLFFNSHQRWLLASATDTPRYFAEELDGLGFQMKEWHWSTSREQLLADLVFNRKVVGDQPFRDCKNAGHLFAFERRKLSPYETNRLQELGHMVAHAVEATARNFAWGDSEDEIAGHLAHRLLRHGVEPVALQVTGDGRGREFRRRSAGSDVVEHSCMLQATGRKFGLHVTASRTVFRNHPEVRERNEFDAALRLRVSHLAATRVGERVASTLEAGKTLLRNTVFEHEWWLTPPLLLTGREPSEGVFLAGAQDRWHTGWAAVWQERIGAAAVVDTYVLTSEEWLGITPPMEWPIRRAVVPGRSFDLPDLLVRED